MRRLLSILLVLSVMSCTPLIAQSAIPFCPTNAVFLALQNQIRGYSTRANGPTVPCQILQGALTNLSTANSISISTHGNLHVLQFLTDGDVSVFGPNAYGNVAPERVESSYTNDLIGIATDNLVDDFVLSRREGPSIIVVVLPGTTVPAYTFSDPALAVAGGIAVDGYNNLLIAGYDRYGNAIVDTFGTSTNLVTPALIETISGPATGMLAGDLSNFSQNTISVAVDPDDGEIYVYTHSAGTGKREVSVFPAGANGNVKPSRVITGGATQLGPPVDLVNKIAVSFDGRLFVAEANNRILVFAPGASGDVPPAQIIQDSTIGNAQIPQGGIAVRSCHCQ